MGSEYIMGQGVQSGIHLKKESSDISLRWSFHQISSTRYLGFVLSTRYLKGFHIDLESNFPSSNMLNVFHLNYGLLSK